MTPTESEVSAEGGTEFPPATGSLTELADLYLLEQSNHASMALGTACHRWRCAEPAAWHLHPYEHDYCTPHAAIRLRLLGRIEAARTPAERTGP